MAVVAGEALYNRLMRSGLAEQLVNDVRLLSGVDIEVIPIGKVPPAAAGHLVVSIHVGKVPTAALVGPAGMMPERRTALKRILVMLAEAVGYRILYHGAEVVESAIPGTVSAAARILRERGTEEDLTLKEVADAVGLGRERLSRLFHASLGLTFSDYLNQVRLEKCCHLLRSSKLSVTDVAFASGFQSISQFNRRFKAAEGISPREYRRRHQR